MFGNYYRAVIRKILSVRITKQIDKNFILVYDKPLAQRLIGSKEKLFRNRLIVLKTVIFVDELDKLEAKHHVLRGVIPILEGHLRIRIGREEAIAESKKWREANRILNQTCQSEIKDKTGLLKIWTNSGWRDIMQFETDDELVAFANFWRTYNISVGVMVNEMKSFWDQQDD